LISTKDKILNEAEKLFAEQGFAETSLRMITAKADVNLASVNYHFGSKKKLIQAVFERFMDTITQDITSEMDKLDAAHGRDLSNIQISEVLQLLKQPIKNLDQLRPDGAGVFMNLLGRSYAETQGHIRRFAMDKYSQTFNRFISYLQASCPQSDASEIFWRLHFMLGSFIFSLAGHRALQEIAESDFNQSVSIEQIIDKLIPFMTAAFAHN